MTTGTQAQLFLPSSVSAERSKELKPYFHSSNRWGKYEKVRHLLVIFTLLVAATSCSGPTETSTVEQSITVDTLSEKEEQQSTGYEFSLPYRIHTDGNDWQEVDLTINEDSLVELKFYFYAQDDTETDSEELLTGKANLLGDNVIISFDKNYIIISEMFIPEESENDFEFVNDSTIQFDKLTDELWIGGSRVFNWGK